MAYNRHINGFDSYGSKNEASFQRKKLSTCCNVGTGGYHTTDSGLVAYWKFDELKDLGINSVGEDEPIK
jgi:hypothetical protein